MMRSRPLIWFLCAVLAFAGTATAAPTQAGTAITYVVPRDIRSLDPYFPTDVMHNSVIQHIYDRLVYVSPNGKLEAMLATRWTVSSNGLEWTLTLRDGVRFHDGTPLTAEAVKRSFDWALDTSRPYGATRFLLAGVEEIRVVDRLTIVFRLGAPKQNFIYMLGGQRADIISPTAIERHGFQGISRNPSGTGPFKLKEWRPGVALVLERNENYWGRRGNVQEIRVITVPESTARGVMLATGEADIAYELNPLDALRLRRQENIEVVNVPSYFSLYLMFNTTKAPFDKKEVRQAIAYAIDKQAIVNRLLLGWGHVAAAPVPSNVYGHAKQQPYERNLQRARELLADAGFPNGFSTPFWVQSHERAFGEAIAAQLRQVGITANITLMEASRWREETRKGQATNEVAMTLAGFGSYAGHIDDVIRITLHSSAFTPEGFNRSFYSNPRVDQLLDQAIRETSNQARQLQLYAEAQRLIWEDAPQVWLFVKHLSTAYSNRLQGVIVHPGNLIYVREASVR